ncbi:hypothetical protein [Halopiger goleimassiliensis]|uniref:hypothetical protein n=1 Tax=Halopiger goleimassiliensis TaxID=1293048 RepID=UPI000678170F|nr:hypothetical protein [Halopiger goleimassiliensis]
MRPLRTCDFCDETAAGTFAVVPPELEPTEAEQRRVVLCDDCRDRLETLLEPLLERAGASTDDTGGDRELQTGSAESVARSDDGGGDDGDGSVVATADRSTATESRTRSPNAAVSDAETSDGDAIDEAGITFETDAGGSSDETGDAESPASDSTGAVDAGLETERAAADDSASEASGDETTETDAEASANRSSPPRAYGKVVRLLRNRELPMKRADVEELAAGAYDLEAHEAEAIVDYAVESGEFEERRGKLYRS